jgi:hypothetical protein
MKTTDWAWSGRGRRHGRWWMTLGPVHFRTSGSPRWLLRLPGVCLQWWPLQRHERGTKRLTARRIGSCAVLNAWRLCLVMRLP